MRIVFDGRWLGRTGIGRYAEELLKQLQRLDEANEYYVLLLPEWYEKWQPSNPRFKAVRTTYEVYTWQEQVLLPRQIAELKPDLVHFTSFNVPFLYGGDFVTTLHDLTLVHFKNVRGEGFKRLIYEAKYWVMRLVLWAAARRAKRVIVPVEFVKAEVAKLFPFSREKLVVTLEAVNPNFAEPADLRRLGLPEKFLLYVGNYYPYKNVGRLVEAFAQTKARQSGVKLVLNGKPEHFQNQVREKARELGLDDAVIWPGYTTDGELAAMYQQTELFVMPSLSEGFALPGLEAMLAGAPVLSARASCMPEVYGDAAAYFDPYDVDNMARQIDALLNDPERLKKLRAAGQERVKRFSWETMAQLTLAVYKAAADKANR